MAEPATNEFVERLRAIAAEHPSRAALARVAGLPPSSLQSYFDGVEPTRPALVALARAAEVSLEWLAEGRGYRKPRPSVPDGYAQIPFYDVRKAGGYIYPLVAEDIAELLYLKLDWFSYPGMQVGDFFSIEAPDSLLPEVAEGDLLVVDRSRRTRFIAASPTLPLGIYLISLRARFSVRRVLHASGDSVELAGVEPKTQKELAHLGQEGFMLHGKIVWCGKRLSAHAKSKPRSRVSRER